MIFLAVAFPTPGSFSSSASLAELMSTLAAGVALFVAWANTLIGDRESSPSINAARNDPPTSTILSLATDLSFSFLSFAPDRPRRHPTASVHPHRRGREQKTSRTSALQARLAREGAEASRGVEPRAKGGAEGDRTRAEGRLNPRAALRSWPRWS